MARPTRAEILETSKKMIHDFVPELKDAELTEESTVNTDAGLDSMSMILVITKMEGKYNAFVPSEDWPKIKTLGDLVNAIEAYLPEDGAEADPGAQA